MKTPAERLYEVVASSTHFTDDIDEGAALALHRAGPWQSLSGGEQASLLIALSLHGVEVPVNLRKCFMVMDHAHVELCIDAITETAGVT